MDRIQKALKKLDAKERELVKRILLQLNQGDLTGLQLTKLTGRKDLFRVRKGRLRIIFRRSNGEIFIVAVERRRERTYKGL
jgi:mRNA-degrading endonuclease RelE of RelBE toxin-antitoxin system